MKNAILGALVGIFVVLAGSVVAAPPARTSPGPVWYTPQTGCADSTVRQLHERVRRLESLVLREHNVVLVSGKTRHGRIAVKKPTQGQLYQRDIWRTYIARDLEEEGKCGDIFWDCERLPCTPVDLGY